MGNCIFSEGRMIHVWTYAGNPDYFPYEGMKCDCGETEWHKEKFLKKCGCLIN